MRRALLLLLLVPLALALPASAQQVSAPGNSASIMGRWWTQNRDGVVDIEPCPAGLCGFVAGITEFHADGSPPVDFQGRSRCRLQIIPDGAQEPDGTWDSHITDPDDGKTYTLTMRLDREGRLRVRGYIGIPLFGRTVFWTRFTGRTTPDCHIG